MAGAIGSGKTMTSRVEIYGLVVTAPVPLPAPPPERANARTDVVVHFGERPPDAATWSEKGEHVVYVSDECDGALPVLLADRPGDGQLLRLRYAEGIRFHVAMDGSSVWADWCLPLTEADAVSFLLGPVLGVVLRCHGVLALHASAVVHRGVGWAFLGPGGSGKSTLAAACAEAGLATLTEDVLAVRSVGGVWRVARGYSQVRVWEDVLPLLSSVGHAPPPLSVTWPKRTLDLVALGLPFADREVPLGGILVLDEPGPAGVAPRLTPVTSSEALVELVANAYVNYLLEPQMLARELRELASIARKVPVWRLAPAAGREGVAATVALVTGLEQTRGATA